MNAFLNNWCPQEYFLIQEGVGHSVYNYPRTDTLDAKTDSVETESKHSCGVIITQCDKKTQGSDADNKKQQYPEFPRLTLLFVSGGLTLLFVSSGGSWGFKHACATLMTCSSFRGCSSTFAARNNVVGEMVCGWKKYSRVN